MVWSWSRRKKFSCGSRAAPALATWLADCRRLGKPVLIYPAIQYFFYFQGWQRVTGVILLASIKSWILIRRLKTRQWDKCTYDCSSLPQQLVSLILCKNCSLQIEWSSIEFYRVEHSNAYLISFKCYPFRRVFDLNLYMKL